MVTLGERGLCTTFLVCEAGIQEAPSGTGQGASALNDGELRSQCLSG